MASSLQIFRLKYYKNAYFHTLLVRATFPTHLTRVALIAPIIFEKRREKGKR